MCNKLCTYRKYIPVDINGNFDCTENPHILLSARNIDDANFSLFAGYGAAAVNLNKTNYWRFYQDIYNMWVYQTISGLPVSISASATPQFGSLTQTGFLVGNQPLPPFNNQLQITENFNTYNIQTNGFIGGQIINYSKPPFDFIENISADSYVPPFTYLINELLTNTSNNILLVEFLDVTGKYCQYA